MPAFRRHPTARFMGPAIGLSIALSIGLSAGAASAVELRVEVLGARSAQGTVNAALYGDADGWMKPPRMLQGRMAGAADKVVLVFPDLPPGRYALTALHDENGNGRLDMNPAGSPIEAYGFSRDAQGRMGPPGFEEAAFELQGDTALSIHLR